jgi:hypothetical protein
MNKSKRFRGCVVVSTIAGLATVLSGCDTSDQHVVVVNECGEVLTIAIQGSSIPISDEAARADAIQRGESVAPDASVSAYFMSSMGGVVISALAEDGSVASILKSFDDPARSFTLSPEDGTCPQHLTKETPG